MSGESQQNDPYVRRSVIITFLWLVAMLVGGLLLLRFDDVLQSAF